MIGIKSIESLVQFLAQDPSPIACVRDCQGYPLRWTFDGRSWFGTHEEMIQALTKEYNVEYATNL